MTNTFDTEIATKIGLVESIVYAKFQEWQEYADINELNSINGQYYISMGATEMNRALKFISPALKDSAIDVLIANGMLIRTKNHFYKVVEQDKIQAVATKKQRLVPTEKEVYEFAEKQDRVDLVAKFFNYYENTDWKRADGSLVKNWKSTFLAWCDKNPKEKSREVL